MSFDVDRGVDLVRGPDGKGKVSLIEVAADPFRNQPRRVKGGVAIVVPEALDAAAAWASRMNNPSAVEDAIERAFWEFDAERCRSGAERDAFKGQMRAILALLVPQSGKSGTEGGTP